MQFLLNELSLHNQYKNLHDFQASLKQILRLRKFILEKGYHLFCTDRIHTQSVSGSQQFNQVLMKTQDHNMRMMVLSWLSKDGPYWDKPPEHDFGQDYFTLAEDSDNLVTGSALAEAAFKVERGELCSTISFSPSNYCFSPIKIVWYQNKKSVTIRFDNFWEAQSINEFLENLPVPVTSWKLMVDVAKNRFQNLLFGDDLLENLIGIPFQQAVANRSFELLAVLNELRQCFDDNGNRTQRGHEIIQNHFHGDSAHFSDESENNKHRFRKELTFILPNGEEVFCPFHGKIRTAVFRIHFTWPMTANSPTFIAYIGPKITRH